MITITRQGELLVAAGCSFEQSQWLGEQGFWFYGRRSRKPLPLPLNTRYLPVREAATVAHLIGAEGLDWSPEARAVVAPKAEAQAASWASDADLAIPAPEGLAYRPYQRAGVAFALDAFARGQRGVLIGDEMGLGKTMQAIGVMALTRPARTLVVCPASLVLNWVREIQKWLPDVGRVHAVNGGEPVPEDAAVVVLNYDKVVGQRARAKALREALGAASWDLAVFDEAHLLKNPAAQRTRFFLGTFKRGKQTARGLVDGVARVLMLTGTPIQNKVRESATLLRAVGAFDGPLCQGEGRFLFRYCGPQRTYVPGRGDVTTFDGATNLPELNAKLRSGGIMVRRLKHDVATELPPKLRSVIALAGDDADTIAPMGIAHRIDAIEGDLVDFGASVQSLLREVVGFEQIAAERAAIAAAKCDAVVEHLTALLDEQDKVIVFAHHQVLVDAVEAAFEACSIRIDGQTPPAARQGLVDRFQTDPACRVAVLSTHAAGVGLTLTAASVVVFAEADWNPSWCVQAEDRAHRIGQDADVVTAQYLVLDGSLDAHVVRTMVVKMDIADRALDARKAAPAPAPASPPPPPPAATPTGPREVTLTPRKGPAITYAMDDARRDAVAEALLYLSGQCDGAKQRDDVGFNGRDAHSDFVQNLVRAAAGGLSDKQAAWGLKILTTYKYTQIAHLAPRLWPEAEAE